MQEELFVGKDIVANKKHRLHNKESLSYKWPVHYWNSRSIHVREKSNLKVEHLKLTNRHNEDLI